MRAAAESAVRLALGATRGRLVRQSLVEAGMLTAIGTLVGVAGARAALGGLTALVQADLPPWFDVGFDWSVLLFAGAAMAVTALAVGALPALHASRGSIERVLRQETGRGAGSVRQQRARRLMLAGQAAFATMLLIAAAIFVGGLRDLLHIEPGFDPDHTLTFRTDPPFVRYPDIRTTSEFYRRTVDSLRAVPGVDAAATNTALPFSGVDAPSPRISVEGRSTGRPDEEPFANIQLISPDYFQAMRIPLRDGRTFSETDREETTPVAIVSERAARRLWGGESPIGRRLRLVWNQSGIGFGGGSELWLSVVGVAGSVRYRGLDDESGLDVYAPNTQLFAGDSYFVVRTAMDPSAVLPQIRGAIDRIDRDQSFFDVATMTTRVNGTIWQHRVASAVLTVFASVALCLAVVGTYAVTSFAVAAERREIGIRLALGSSAAQIVWLVARRSLAPVIAGAFVGLGAGAAAARALADLIGLTTAPDVTALALLPALLAAAAAVAAYLPARASLRRIPVTEALRTP
jgi:putative ABC transport system permease protein